MELYQEGNVIVILRISTINKKATLKLQNGFL